MTRPSITHECCGKDMIYDLDTNTHTCVVCEYTQLGILYYPLHHWPKKRNAQGWRVCPFCFTERKQRKWKKGNKSKYKYRDPITGTLYFVAPKCGPDIWVKKYEAECPDWVRRMSEDGK